MDYNGAYCRIGESVFYEDNGRFFRDYGNGNVKEIEYKDLPLEMRMCFDPPSKDMIYENSCHSVYKL